MSDQLVLEHVDPLADAIAWRERNPRAWRAIVTWALQHAAHGIRPSTRLYLCLLRNPEAAADLNVQGMPGDPVKVNDHLSAGLARLLEREYGLDCGCRTAAVDSWSQT